MKYFFLFTFYCFFQSAFAQNSGDVNIDWIDGNYPYYENNTLDIPWFKSDNFVYQEGKIYFIKKVETDGFVDENSLIISNIVFEDVPIRLVSKLKQIPTTIEPSLKNITARDVVSSFIELSPIIKNGNSYKRVKSFTYSYTSSLQNDFFDKKSYSGIVHSVLATGEWKKFYIEKSGVYKISKAFLKDIGFNVNVDPRTIKVYGNGGRMIPLLNATPYPDDLTENAISFVGEQDGVFDDNDYILFYGEGVDTWNNDSSTFNNLYSNRSYYYITSSTFPSKRISSLIEPTALPNQVFTSYDKIQFYEVDKNNIWKVGRRWYGDAFNINLVQNFSFDFPNIDVSQPLKTEIWAVGDKVVNANINVNCNGQNLGNMSLSSSQISNFSSIFTSNSPSVNFRLSYNNGGVPTSNAYLDYIKLEGKCFLKGYGKQFSFEVKDAATLSGVASYQFTNAGTISQIWDITDIYNVSSKINNGLAAFDVKANLGAAARYIAIDNSDFYVPIKDSDSSVANQDLKGTLFLNEQGFFQDIDYLIVTPNFLYTQAKKLADFHKQYSGLTVKVVTLDKIYHEFSSGKQDVGAIRNLVKYVYNNASIPLKRVRYICLFGDASYDYKDRILNNTNIVPTFEAKSGFDLDASAFVTDDFYGLMDTNEGDPSLYHGIDVAVGRIIASSVSQAEEMLNKIFEYHDSNSYGKWKSNISIFADDPDVDTGDGIQVNANNAADNLILNKPFFNVKKVLMDSYLQQVTSGGEKYPKVNDAFLDAFQKGSLVVSYLGHGSQFGLAQERVFELNDVVNLKNQFNYPLFISVSCEYSPFDNPNLTSAGEYLFLNPKGGAIALISTNRKIQVPDAYSFNSNLNQYLYAYGTNPQVSIAEAVRLTKNLRPGGTYNVVSMLGDPALFLAIPKPNVVLTKINDTPIASSTDVLQSLGFVKLSGEVVDANNNFLNNYNGNLYITIYDKDIVRTTLANDNIRPIIGYTNTLPPQPIYGPAYRLTFNDQGEVIFRGNSAVTNGKFEFGFTVPKDIRIQLGNGKISFYIKSNDKLEDRIGCNTTVKVGGVNLNAVADTTPPKVRIYLNTETFVSGGITNQSPLFFAHLEDEHGINTAGGIGHDIVAILDGNESNPYVLNDYYETEPNDYTKGKLKFPFKKLSLGLHTLTFRAWDSYNNLIKSELQFVVVGDDEITLSNVLNYPNPFVNYTEFWFSHNKPFEPLEVQVQVMTITGKIVWTKNQTVTTDGFLSREITWDGKDDFGDAIGKGVYIYKLKVKSMLTHKTAEKIEKLVIL